ncbi:hypothetical protein [Bernardetia sp.]|uniref:capsular polysaccharide export protein, LipB/KpsS family n=1 Tax=Bernardetia sp. TaxID=1937974 RepID=UPI0025BDA20C|nr:hypothetical protein [Bernardetia sp.]
MNIIVFTTWTVQHFLPAVHAEIITSHLEKGHNVKVIVCDAQLHSCFIPHLLQENQNKAPFKDKSTCTECQFKWLSVLKNDVGVKKEDIISLKPFPKNIALPSFKSHDEIRNHQYQDINIGVGILSTLISLSRNVDVDIVEYRPSLEAIYKNAISAVETMNSLKDFAPDKVYIYNGRLAERRAVVEFCKLYNIDYDTWEVAQSLQHYYLVNKTLPHNPKPFALEAIERFYDNTSISQETKTEIGHQWYNTKRYGHYEDKPNDINYGKLMQNTDISSLQIDKSKTNVALFVSSEDEIASLGKDIWPFEYRQTESIQKIISYFDAKDDNNVHLYLRIHPNLRGLDNAETKKLKSLKGNCLTVIPSESPLNSYALLDECDKIVCFSSTIGIEATYWQKPSILFGTSAYKHIDNSIHIANTIEEVCQLIEDKNLSPKSIEAALIYAYGLLNRGKQIKALDIYQQPVKELYNKNKLLYPIYKLYKKSDTVGKVVRFLNLQKITKNILVRFGKN